jgi:hypothetical protein
MKRTIFLAVLGGALSWGGSIHASLIEEFLFDDPSGTALPSTVNSVPGAHAWADDLQGDLAGAATNGLGQYSLAAKTNNELATALVNNDPDITSGVIYGVMELTWDFDPATLNAAENEEMRLTIINLNTAGSSSVTAEFAIIRQDDNTVAFSGAAVSGTAIAGVPINLTQSTKFIGVVGVNLDADIYSIYLSDDAGTSFTSLTGGTIDPARIGAQLRMVLNNDLSQDDVLIDRVALYTHNPYPGLIIAAPEPSTVALVVLTSMAIAQYRRRKKSGLNRMALAG